MTAQTETPKAETGSCCTADGSCHSTPAADEQQGAVTVVYQVSGMTCGHCEGAIASEISEIAGVTSVKAVAATGEVTVVSEAPLDEAAVRAAVDEAGYELTGKAA
ncbi:heavy-metal-associated domain-containing protein [Streptomyces sp. O3]